MQVFIRYRFLQTFINILEWLKIVSVYELMELRSMMVLKMMEDLIKILQLYLETVNTLKQLDLKDKPYLPHKFLDLNR